MKTFDAYHLPGVDVHTLPMAVRAQGSIELRYPQLNAEQIAGIAANLKQRRRAYLVAQPVTHIVDAIASAVDVLRTRESECVLLVSQVTGYSEPVVAETLAHMFRDWSADALHQMVRAELGDARALDTPIDDPHVPGKRIAAYGYPLTFQVFSGNVPGVAVTSIIRALLVKSATLGKVASGEPVLSILFASALREVAPGVADCLALTYWPGERTDLNEAAARNAEAVIIYGGEDAVQSVRARTSGHQHVVVHGPRMSFGIAGAHTSAADVASIARAVAAYDQQGCVSPHVLYVQGANEEAHQMAARIADELASIAAKLPRGRISTGEAVAIRNARAAAEFGACAELFGDEHGDFSVIYEEDPAFRVSCLNRVLYVKPLADIQQLGGLLPRADVLQSVAVCGFPENEKAELIHMLGLSGVSRITSFEQLPWPPMHWHHDGSAPLRELITWMDIEA